MRAVLFLALVAGLAVALGVQVPVAHAATGTISYFGNGSCVVNGTGSTGSNTLDVRSSSGRVYGFGSTSEWIHIYMALVDTNGSLQYGWVDLGWYHASASAPVSFNSLVLNRTRLQTYSRFILGVQWYQGNTLVGWSTRTLSSYDNYTLLNLGVGGGLPVKQYTGTVSACFL